MQIRFFTPLTLGVSAMLVAAAGYAGAQTTQTQNPPAAQQTQQDSGQNSHDVAAPNAPYAISPNTKLASVNAKLESDLNSKHARQGETVKAKLTDSVEAANGMKLDDGTLLIGKVNEVQKSQDNGPARLSVTFDQARLKDGRTIPVKATLLAVYPPNTGSFYPDAVANGALMASQPKYIAPDQKINQEPGTLSHIGMHSAVQSSASGTFTSNDRNINLKRGTQLQIAIAPGASASMG